jgi:hypothetical protein
MGKRHFAGDITLRARLDQDGNAMSVTAGDIMTKDEMNVAVGNRDIKLVLDKVVEESN